MPTFLCTQGARPKCATNSQNHHPIIDGYDNNEINFNFDDEEKKIINLLKLCEKFELKDDTYSTRGNIKQM